MPRQEETKPWATCARSTDCSYPRKNLYFNGTGMRELYDFLIWYGSSGRHLKLDASYARTSAEVIADWLLRGFLCQMTRPRVARAFSMWRLKQYVEGGLDEESAAVRVRNLQLQLIAQLQDVIRGMADYEDGVLPDRKFQVLAHRLKARPSH